MPLLNPTVRTLRTLPRLIRASQFPVKDQYFRGTVQGCTRHIASQPRHSNENGEPKIPMDAISFHRLEEQRRAYYKRRAWYSGAGFVFGMVAIWFIATSIPLDPDSKLDASRKDDPLVVIGRERKVIVQKLGEEPEEVPDVVETGTSTVPTFPRLLEFVDTVDEGDLKTSAAEDGMVEYQLLGLGIRTVSFLGIEVYVVGMYIATDDIALLQRELIRRINPIATTLVSGERGTLREKLLNAEDSEKLWNEVLRDTGVRTLLRIVPTRNTDFGHLRDAWVRSITARAKRYGDEFGDDAFGGGVNDFKTIFRKGSVPKNKELLFARNQKGVMAIWYDNGKAIKRLGDIKDERISRSVWLNYLGGKTVASESARKNIVDGVMQFVERPVGSVASQVHV